MSGVASDIRFWIRDALKRPGFALTVIGTMALAIGANAAVFSVVNAVLLRPLPFPESDRLSILFTQTTQGQTNAVSYPDLQDWRQQSESFSDLAGFSAQSVNLTGTEEPTRVVGCFVSANFFQTLRVDITRGRGFLPGDDQPGAERVALVSDGVWRERFGADQQMIGKTLILNGQTFTVVGIMPESFHFQVGDPDVCMPLQYYPNFSLDRGRSSALVLGRLATGVPLKAAQAEMNTIAARLADQYPSTNRDRGVRITPLQELTTQDVKPSLLVLLAAVGSVLLIACANIANISVARSLARKKEFALRAALGASRTRLIRQLLTETISLALVGGGAGVLAGIWGTELLTAYTPGGLPPGTVARVDLPVLLTTLGVSVLCGVAFGLAPALKFSRPDIQEELKEGGRSFAQGPVSSRLHAVLVVVQVAMALVLLICSGLITRSFLNILAVSPGFSSERLLTMEYRVPRTKYSTPEQQWNFHHEVVERVRALQGTESASVVLALPYSGNGGTTGVIPLDRPEPPSGSETQAQRNTADTYYFDTMKIPLLNGRVFDEHDRPNAPRVAVINKAMSELFWPDQSPIGKQVRITDGTGTMADNSVLSIVGVVGNVKHFSLDEATMPQFYVAYAQNPFIFATLVVRTTGEPLSMARTVQQAVWSVDKDQPVWKIRTMEFLLERSTGPRRFVMALLLGFSGMALLLSILGIYGVVSYTVRQRTQEMGVRVALGASRKDIVRLIVGRGVVMTLAGVATGVFASALLSRFLSSLLFGVTATDPATYSILSLLILVVATAAAYIPARRASKIDPIVTLRCE